MLSRLFIVLRREKKSDSLSVGPDCSASALNQRLRSDGVKDERSRSHGTVYKLRKNGIRLRRPPVMSNSFSKTGSLKEPDCRDSPPDEGKLQQNSIVRWFDVQNKAAQMHFERDVHDFRGTENVWIRSESHMTHYQIAWWSWWSLIHKRTID